MIIVMFVTIVEIISVDITMDIILMNINIMDTTVMNIAIEVALVAIYDFNGGLFLPWLDSADEDGEGAGEGAEEEPVFNELFCVACNKPFRTEKQ